MNCMVSQITVALLLFLNFASAQENNTKNLQMNPQETIAANAAKSQNHTTLLAAIEGADLEEVLSTDGPFTIFAPTDLAFQKLSDTSIDKLLLAENKKHLHSLVTYHIVAGNLSASNILKAMCRGNGTASFITINGEELTATMEGIEIVLSDSNGNTAKITIADSKQSNGMLHEIDSVFLPVKL